MVTENATPKYWLESVTILGSEAPVRVVEEDRNGSYIVLRQVDPCEPSPNRVPIYEGDTFEVMTAISHISLHSSDEEDSNSGFFFSIRVIPVRRESKIIFVRTLRFGESDDGSRVHIRSGDSLSFEIGSLVAELDYIDSLEPATDSGHVPLSPVLVTWFSIGHENSDGKWLRYLLAAARRLDTANLLLMEVEKRRTELSREDIAGPAIRRAAYELIGAVEMAIVALGRVADMALKARDSIDCRIQVPEIIITSSIALMAIRDSFEHIEDRAIGQVRNKANLEALTIFDHAQILANDRIVYGDFELDLKVQVPNILVEAREFFKSSAIYGKTQ